MRVIFWRGDAASAVEIGKELLAAAQGGLLQQGDAAEKEAIALEENAVAVEENIRRQMEELERRSIARVSQLRADAGTCRLEGTNRKKEADGISKALDFLS